MSRSVGLLCVVVTVLGAGCRRGQGEGQCLVAFEARDWGGVQSACVGNRWSAHAALGRAWQAAPSTELAAVKSIAAPFIGTALHFDALCLSGYVLGRGGADPEVARQQLWQAYFGYLVLGRRRSAVAAATFLSHAPRSGERVADALMAAEVAVLTAETTRSGQARGDAETALAEVYDDLGMAEDAREAFFRAEERLRGTPPRLAYAYLKHGIFLVDQGTDVDARAALQYLAAADAELARLPNPNDELAFAVRLNRADALIQLGDPAGAAAALAVTPKSAAAASRLAMVAAYLAAATSDRATLAARLAEVDDWPAAYRVRLALELARLHRREGRFDEAVEAYRRAIAAVEELRADAGGFEVRPWVLRRWARPYLELLALLVERGRPVEALAVASDLHARSWLDAVVAGARHEGAEAVATLRDAHAAVGERTEAPSPGRSGADLVAGLGGREAIVLVDDGGAPRWRFHVLGGVVTASRLTDVDRAALMAFTRTPEDALVAEQAGRAVVPAEVAASDEPLYVVASGSLAVAPLAALRHDGRFLIEARPLQRVLGLAALECPRGPWSGPPRYVGDARGDLPAAAAEVHVLGGETALTGDQATVGAVRASAAAPLLHLAVHGRRTGRGVVLELADDVMSAAEVVAWRVAPRLVVLAGCDTARSGDPEGWASFPGAFLAAGALHVVATSRPVEDEDAAAFARAFYGQREAVAAPLRVARAQRALLDGGAPVSAWSAFAVWGAGPCDGSSRE